MRNTLNGRRNIYEVFRAWLGNRPHNGGGIHTDGTTIYSYGTAILTRGLVVAGTAYSPPVLNTKKYSLTTTRHQNGIREGLNVLDWPANEVDGLPQGASAVRLQVAGREAA